MFDDFRASLLCVVLACDRGELIDVHDIFGRFLVARAEYELKLVGLDPNSLKKGSDNLPVVFSSGVDEFDRGLQVIQERVDIGEEDDHLAVSSEELGDLNCRNKVSSMGTSEG